VQSFGGEKDYLKVEKICTGLVKKREMKRPHRRSIGNKLAEKRGVGLRLTALKGKGEPLRNGKNAIADKPIKGEKGSNIRKG